MSVALPELFMALAFEPPSETHMDASELELCRISTMDYLLPKLQSHYPQLLQLKMQFNDFEWGSGKPTPKFQAYWKVEMSMKFNVASSSQQSSLPRPVTLFEKTGELFQKDFYFEFLKTTLKGGSCKVLTTASDVRFGLLSESIEGGAVKSPNFYIGFVCTPSPTQRPTQEQCECLRQYVLRLMLQTTREGYPTSFHEEAPGGGLTLVCVKSEINDQAGKPLQKFNLYIEFEAIGIFRKNAPSAMAFYVQLASFSLGEFLYGVKQMGGYYAAVKAAAINPCAWIENLQEAVPIDPMALGEMIPVHVEFWLALVIPVIAAAPNDPKLLGAFDEMMKEVVHTILVNTYGSYNFHSIELQRESCEFQANVPLPRFNILHRYQADIFFQNPIPLPAHVLTTIMRCDVGTLHGGISELPAPWNATMEATLGNAMFEHVSEEKVYEGRRSDVGILARTPPPKPLPKQQQRKEPSPIAISVQPSPIPCRPPSPTAILARTPPPTPVFQPKQQQPELPKPRGELSPVAIHPTPIPMKPSPTPVQPSLPPQLATAAKPPCSPPVPTASPKGKSMPVKPPSPVQLRPPENTNATLTNSTKEITTTVVSAPTPLEPRSTPTDSLEFWAEIYVALSIPEQREPTPAEYDMLAKATQSHYTKFLSKKYGKDTFERIVVSVRDTKFNAGIPESTYNVYAAWDVKAYFNATNGKAPNRLQFCSALVSEIDMFVYLKDKVRGIRKTPFENAVAIYTEQVNSVLEG